MFRSARVHIRALGACVWLVLCKWRVKLSKRFLPPVINCCQRFIIVFGMAGASSVHYRHGLHAPPAPTLSWLRENLCKNSLPGRRSFIRTESIWIVNEFRDEDLGWWPRQRQKSSSSDDDTIRRRWAIDDSGINFGKCRSGRRRVKPIGMHSFQLWAWLPH